MAHDTHTMICPKCSHFTVTPHFGVIRMQFETRVQYRIPGQQQWTKIWLPMLQWTCPGCQQIYSLTCCSTCGCDLLAPQGPDDPPGWGLQCVECARRSTLAG